MKDLIPYIVNAREISDSPGKIKFSICTLVNNKSVYSQALQSFHDNGFDAADVEFLYIDNTLGNRVDAYQACNLFLIEARGAHIILCHQDIVLINDGRSQLEYAIQEVARVDPYWGVVGNAGVAFNGKSIRHLKDPHGSDKTHSFPIRVQSVDENFMVVRRNANLVVSHDLSGFHLVGGDLSAISAFIGLRNYIIDFYLYHKSGGSLDISFTHACKQFTDAYKKKLSPSLLQTPCTTLCLSQSQNDLWKVVILNNHFLLRLFRKYFKVEWILKSF